MQREAIIALLRPSMFFTVRKMNSSITQLLADLVRIDSINPDLTPGGAGEYTIAHFIAAWLRQAGLEVLIDEVLPGRPNVVGIARGSGGGRTLLLNGHIDTVGITNMVDPHTPVIRDGRLYGRGAYDMKGGLAACMVAAAAARQHKLRGDVVIAAVMDEEYAGLGTMDIVKRYRADGAIIAEPTEMEAVVAHKGFAWFELETHGVAAHGSRPDLGVDAIVHMGRLLCALDDLNTHLLANPRHPLLKSGSLHAAVIRGGQELSCYPALCQLAVERRTIPSETPELAEAQLVDLIERLSHEHPSFRATLRRTLDREPMETPADAPIRQLVTQHAAAVLGRSVPEVGAAYWTDAATLDQAGIPTLLFGPAGAGAHAVEEWVDVASVAQCAAIYARVMVDFCA